MTNVEAIRKMKQASHGGQFLSRQSTAELNRVNLKDSPAPLLIPSTVLVISLAFPLLCLLLNTQISDQLNSNPYPLQP